MATNREACWNGLPLPETPLGKVQTVDASDTVMDTVRLLRQKNILSAPVVDGSKPPSAPWQERYLGIVDVIKLVVFMLDSFETPASISEEDEDEDLEDIGASPDFSRLPSEFAQEPLSAMLERKAAGWLPFQPADHNSSLLTLAKELSRPEVKRVPILNAVGKVSNMVSQSSVVGQLLKYDAQCAPLLLLPLDQTSLAEPHHVFSIHMDRPVKDAFRLMRDKSISAVPVVDHDGIMSGNISAEHIFFIATARNKMLLLQLSAAKFLELIATRGRNWDIKSNAITCRAQDTTGEVMKQMQAAKIHRVYLCDDRNRPYRVISYRDLLASLALP